MVSLPLVYTILALVAYTASFWYLFIHLMSKRAPNQWFVSLTALLGLGLHALVLYGDMHTPLGINYDVFALFSFTSGLMLLLSIIYSTYRPIIALNLIGIPVAATGLILGFVFTQPAKSSHKTLWVWIFILFCLCLLMQYCSWQPFRP